MSSATISSGLQARQLLFVDQDVGVVHLNAHLVGVGDEVGGDIAAIELHALDHVEFGLQALGLFDRDHALVADFLHGIGEELADLGVTVGGDGADLGDLLVRGDFLGVGLEVLDDGVDREIDAALEVHRVHARGHGLGAFAHDRSGQHGRGGGAVAGLVGGTRCDFTHHLRAHVLELVFELDLLGDGDAVLGDARRAERLVEDHVAALRAKGDLHRIGQDVDAAQHAIARIDGEFDVFSSHSWNSFGLMSAKRLGGFSLGGLAAFDHAHDVAFFHDQEILTVDLDFGARPFAEQHGVADLEINRDELARLVAATGADGDDLALARLLFGGIGNNDAAGSLFLGIDALDDNAVVKRAELHGSPPRLLKDFAVLVAGVPCAGT
jgi:hypothetical protein